MAAGALGYAAVVSGVMLLDWRLRLTDVFPSYLEKRQQYVSEVIRGARANPSQAVDLFTQTAPSDNYWNLDRTAVLLGRTESFRFRISGAVLAGPRKRVAAAYDEVIAIVPILEPRTRWVAIQLYADHNFGPLLIEQGYEFIWDRSQKRLLYAPVRQDLFYHHAPTDTTPRDSILDSIITHFEPKLHGAIQLVSTGWQFPGLDFVARPASAPPKFVGAP
jgi:hypothetical protein